MKRLLAYLVLPALMLTPLLSACSGFGTRGGTVRVAVLPILDALPMYVADAQGYFEAEGVQVQFIPVSSAAERDQLMQSEQADAMINDLVSTMLYNKDQTQIQIVDFARVATADFPQYRVLAAKDSGIETIEDLKGVDIGVSEGTVIEYTTDRLLENAGFAPDEIKTLAVPKIPDRMALLNSGELKAANLPDPLASLAIQQGAKVIVDDSSDPPIGNSVISFRSAYIKDHPDAVRGFLAAVQKASTDINGDKAQWSDLLTEKSLVPAPLIGTYKIPDFPDGSVPTQAQFEDVLAWTHDKRLVEADVSYTDSVTADYLPQ
jgi:NitT/TauT family transport system substrate-binding protein